MVRLSDEDRRRIIELRKHGMKHTVIARRMGVSVSTVERVIREYREAENGCTA